MKEVLLDGDLQNYKALFFQEQVPPPQKSVEFIM